MGTAGGAGRDVCGDVCSSASIGGAPSHVQGGDDSGHAGQPASSGDAASVRSAAECSGDHPGSEGADSVDPGFGAASGGRDSAGASGGSVAAHSAASEAHASDNLCAAGHHGFSAVDSPPGDSASSFAGSGFGVGHSSYTGTSRCHCCNTTDNRRSSRGSCYNCSH